MKSSTAAALTETSVTFSLAELAALEAERERAEASEAARLRDARRRERALADERAREAEAARIRAEVEERARRTREDEEEKARVAARVRVDAEVARIEAEARARLAVDDAARAHELSVLHAKAADGRGGLRLALAGAIAIALLFGGFGAHAVSSRERRARDEVARAHDEGEAALRRAEAAARAEASRSNERIAGLVRQARRENVAALERRADDLAAWAGARARRDLATQLASIRLRASVDDSDLTAITDSLDRVAAALVSAAPVARVAGAPVVVPVGVTCSNPHDPLCGLDGRVR